MKLRPQNAKLILTAVCLGGFAALAWVAPLTLRQGLSDFPKLVAIVLLSVFLSGKKITPGGQEGGPRVTSLSLGLVLTFVGVLSLGAGGGTVVGVLGMASSCLYPRRQPWFQLLFNVALSAVGTSLSGWVF